MKLLLLAAAAAVLAGQASAQCGQPCSPDKMGRDNVCYRVLRYSTSMSAQAACNDNGPNSSGWRKPTTLPEFKEAAKLYNLPAIWAGKVADDNTNLFDGFESTRPGKENARNLVADPANRCLAYKKRFDGKVDRFITGPCHNICPIVCRRKHVCRGRWSYTFEDMQINFEYFPQYDAMSYNEADDFCREMGGALPFFKSPQSIRPAGQTTCNHVDDIDIWVSAGRTFPNGKNIATNHPTEPPYPYWLMPDGSKRHFGNTVAYDSGQLELPEHSRNSVRAPFRYKPTMHLSRTGPSTVTWVDQGAVKRKPLCMFRCTARQFEGGSYRVPFGPMPRGGA